MIISQAPTRISLFGGGTDVGEYAEKYGGAVLSLAINIRQRFKYGTTVTQFNENGSRDFYKKIMDRLGLKDNFIQEFDGQIQGGMGSSASATVALVGIADKVHGWNLSREEIAEMAWDIEVNTLGMFGGKQDQYASVFGGINVFNFEKGKVEVQPVPDKYFRQIKDYLVLVDLGIKRSNPNLQEGLRTTNDKSKKALDRIKELLIKGTESFLKGDIDTMGSIMWESWEEKKKSNKVSNRQIRGLMDRAKFEGAIGGKLLGSGGGGSALFITKDRQSFIKRTGLKEVDFDLSLDGLDVREI